MRSMLIIGSLLMLCIAGCSTAKPVAPEYRDAVTKGRDPGPDVYRPGQTVLAYDRPGLVGRIAAAQGHVLTTKPNQDYQKVQKRLDEEKKRAEFEAKAKKERLKRLKEQKKSKNPLIVRLEDMDNTKKTSPKNITQSRPSSKIEPRIQAWKHYCNNGEGMTDADIRILKKENFSIPVNFQKNCYPPK